VSTGIRFFDHMIELVARHGAFDLELQAAGDLDIDQHHTVEDVEIAWEASLQRWAASRHSSCRLFRDADGRHWAWWLSTSVGAARRSSTPRCGPA
jgi:hypothetical protein